MRLTDLDKAVAASGLPYETVAGWQRRGKEMARAASIMAHHTATSANTKGNYPSMRTVRDGRPGLPGPLANLGLGRDGKVYVISAGRANHAGKARKTAETNSHSIGIEAEHPGGNAPWPPAQYAAYVRLCAALCRHYRIPVSAVVGHKEAAIPKGRKPDPNFQMDKFRADVQARLNGQTAAPSAPEGAGVPVKDSVLGEQTIIALEKALGVPVTGTLGWTDKWTPVLAPATTQALEEILHDKAYPGDTVRQDGTLTRAEIKALQGTMRHYFNLLLNPADIDGLWGALTTRALQHCLQGVPDGMLKYRLNGQPFPAVEHATSTAPKGTPAK